MPKLFNVAVTYGLSIAEDTGSFGATVRDLLQLLREVLISPRVEDGIRSLLFAHIKRGIVDVDSNDLAALRLPYLGCDLPQSTCWAISVAIR